ncbi:hypothetical protein [Azospirillum agricola]|uniref:hypothetical protein n=1 Tax=Azospirillum agricola TaxID=1720247 RepID=UPI000A0F2632|nr:hypothetical protein [Azospirillum agricola]SMH62839.1 hypothetical protein SAMN02982994_6662 [Azospirillum lipoferum]
MSKIAFVLDDDLVVTAPVHIRVPKSARTSGGVSKQEFVTKTAYVDIRVPPEDELEEVQERTRQHNADLLKRLAEAEKSRAGAEDDEARLAADAEVVRINKDIRNGMTEQLKEFVVALPDGHGIAEKDGSLAVYSPELIERLCAYRHVRTALWDAWLLVLNGDPKKGN